MLETAWQLAERLGGEVLTHDRQVLTDTYVEALRAKLNRKH
jgi:FtsZ-interacting cell division protein ZipA